MESGKNMTQFWKYDVNMFMFLIINLLQLPKNTYIVVLQHISNPCNSIMCTLDGCLDSSDVTPNPKLIDMSLKMAR